MTQEIFWRRFALAAPKGVGAASPLHRLRSDDDTCEGLSLLMWVAQVFCFGGSRPQRSLGDALDLGAQLWRKSLVLRSPRRPKAMHVQESTRHCRRDGGGEVVTASTLPSE